VKQEYEEMEWVRASWHIGVIKKDPGPRRPFTKLPPIEIDLTGEVDDKLVIDWRPDELLDIDLTGTDDSVEFVLSNKGTATASNKGKSKVAERSGQVNHIHACIDGSTPRWACTVVVNEADGCNHRLVWAMSVSLLLIMTTTCAKHMCPRNPKVNQDEEAMHPKVCPNLFSR
jgi:hypothetical protein